VKRAWRAACAATLLAVAGAVACSDIDNHLLTAQEYYPGNNCLTVPEVIDDLTGSDPGDNCAPECLLVPQQGGGNAVFITTECPPYPGYNSVELQDAAKDAADPCVGAFAVYDEDGGAPVCTSLDAEVEASDEADGGKADAAVDGSADAGTGG
jgi:hypothetical protein